MSETCENKHLIAIEYLKLKLNESSQTQVNKFLVELCQNFDKSDLHKQSLKMLLEFVK